MNLSERAELYRKAFPKFQPLSVVDTADGKQRLEGLWIMGNDYRVKSGYYGGYPAGYLDRVMSMFPDAKRTLHLFSGMLETKNPKAEVTFDINHERRPDVCGDAENLAQEIDNATFVFYPTPGKWYCRMCNAERTAGCRCNSFDLVLADPPYSNSDADRYGTIMIRRNKVVHECLKVLRPGGFLVWLDQVFPLHRKAESPMVGTIYVREEFPELVQVGEVGMVKSTNHRVRAVFIFEKVEAKP